MPLLSVTGSSEDGNGGLPSRPPSVLCSLLQAKPINSENLLHVVIRALQSLRNLFLSVPPLNQFRPICFSQDKTAIPARHSFTETPAQAEAAKPAVLVRLEQNSLSEPC